MPRVLRLIAKESVEHRGQTYGAGELITGTLAEVKGLIYRRQVRPEPKGQSIQTRQLSADDAGSPEAITTKRKYRRRDLTAEAS